MIVNHRHRFVYLDIPRTASNSVRAALASIEGSVACQRHLFENALPHRHYFVFTTVRNPYSRVFSHYMYRRTRPHNNMHWLVKHWTFSEYAAWAANPDGPYRKYDDPPMSEWLRPFTLNAVMRFENLHEDFHRLPFVSDRVVLQHINQAGGHEWKEHYNEEIAAIIEQRFEEDFRVFGYAIDSWHQDDNMTSRGQVPCCVSPDLTPLRKQPKDALMAHSQPQPSKGAWPTVQRLPSSNDTGCGDITAILTAYRRPQYLAEQVAAIRAQTVLPKSIWVWANIPDDRMSSALADVKFDRIITSSVNAYFHSRFALALTAPTEYVAVFDDDTIPGPAWFANCLETMAATPGIMGTAGVTLRAPGYEQYDSLGWRRPLLQAIEVDLVGQAWFLRTEWIRFMFYDRPVTGTNGEDIELCSRALRYGGIPTICPPHPPENQAVWGSLFGAQYGHGDGVGSSARPGHYAERDRIVRTEIAAGWRPLFMRETTRVRGKGTGSSGKVGHSSPATSSAGAGSDFKGQFPILPLIRNHRRKILEIRCSDGRQGAALKARQQARIVGIERDEHLAAAAQQKLDEVIVGDVEQLDPDFAPGGFDCVVCNSLAQMKDPWKLLKRVRQWLTPDGQLVAKIPNLRHHSVVSNLLNGRWDSDSAEALRPGNIRFFTRREIEKMLYRAGYEVRQLQPVPGPGYEQWQQQGRPGEVKQGPLQIAGLSPEDAEEFYTAGYLIDAVPMPRPEYGLTSIVILTRNQVEYTRMCLDSIRARTDEPYELIVVDNGSTDATVDYLRSQSDVKLIENPDNRGFPAGCNQGIRAAGGDQILLLNNDVIVTTGWLDRQLRAMHGQHRIGLVGPCSNRVSGLQAVPADYADLASLDGFAWQWGKRHDRVVEDTDRLVGFCLLFRRGLIAEIGLLDEQFGLGNFEDDDFCRRARQAGFRAVIARDAFIHHFGSVTHRAENVDLAALLERNSQLFREKWEASETWQEKAATTSTPKPNSRFSIRVAEGGGLLLERAEIRLSLCMIVCDNADTIEACLTSIKPWVDEMVVVDTGSKDNTPELVRKCGARLFHFPWCDDFAAARNESLKHARGDWIFWMDSDDTIDSENGRKLRKLANDDPDPSVLGYVMQVHCPGAGEEGRTDVTIVDHVKLIRNRPDLRFEGRIHEQILPAIRRGGGEVSFTDVFVVHSGADRSEAGRQRKLERDFHLLQLDLQDRPDHPFVLFNLGMTHGDAGDHQQALDLLNRSIQVSHPTESHVRKAYALLVGSYTQLGRHEEAWTACREGRRHYPDDAELLFREGILHHHFGRLPDAERAYRRALEDRDQRHFSSVDGAIQGFKAHHNLALVYEDMGEPARAEQQWQKVVAEAPTYRLGWRGLVEVLLAQGKLDAAESQVRRLLAGAALPEPLRTEGLSLQGRVATTRGDFALAKSSFQQAVARSPGDLDAWDATCRFLFEYGELRECKEALQRLLQLAPTDGAAHHNLGSVCLQMGEHSQAVEAYRASLRYRPDSPTTHVRLGQALIEMGRPLEAISAWQEALELQPGDPDATEALQRVGLVVAER